MDDLIQYAFRIDDNRETPCHLSEIKKNDVFYLVTGGKKSELFIAIDNAFNSVVNGQQIWSIPREEYE